MVYATPTFHRCGSDRYRDEMDPRVLRTQRAVREATLAVLGDRGYSAFTIEAVAEAAGVAKSTIYRHWPTKLDLIADALETLNRQPSPELGGDTFTERITLLIEHLADAFSDSVLSACIPALIEAAEHNPEVAEFLHSYSTRRRRTLVDAIRRGIEAGELADHLDPELTALALSGPIIYRRTMTPSPLDRQDARRLVDLVLRSQPVSARPD